MIITSMSPITGQHEDVMAVVQDSNLYAFTAYETRAARVDRYVESYTAPPPRPIDIAKSHVPILFCARGAPGPR